MNSSTTSSIFRRSRPKSLEIESLDFDLYSVIEDITELISLKALQKGLDLACLTTPSVPGALKEIPNASGKSWSTSSATPSSLPVGAISTRLTLEEQSEEHLTVKFAVTDTGIGIPADRMDRLFMSFSQVDASTTRTYGRTGLGLAISKQLVELMGGAIGVQSTLGSGSTFWFTVRLGLGAQVRQPATIAAGNPRGLRARQCTRVRRCGRFSGPS